MAHPDLDDLIVTTPARQIRKGTALVLVSLTAVLANASWFSATAVVPALEQQWRLTPAGAAWLVIVVQIGFVLGSVGRPR